MLWRMCTRFTIQSISKIISLMLAILDNGEEYVFSKSRNGTSGDPFNSIRKLETSSRKKPYNPLINAGAIAVASMIKGKNVRERFQRLLEFTRKIQKMKVWMLIIKFIVENRKQEIAIVLWDIS
ncbi:Glutaminase [Fusobacterium necrophorum subsp. necrophorum]|nr:Glutaminase [Fusobacterium necrophorum subsp. necrophorum]